MPPQQLQHWFTQLTANSPFFFAVLDAQHNYFMVNERYCDIAGLSQTELAGMNDRQTLGEQFYQHLKPYYERAFTAKQLRPKLLSTKLTSIPAFISAYPSSKRQQN